MQHIETTPSRDHVVSELARHDISPTRQRVEIGMLLLGRDRHVSADQVLEEINTTASKVVSKATVYNTLGLFASKGLLREVIADPSRVIYDTNISAHHHLFNVETGELRDIPSEAIELSVQSGLLDEFAVEGMDVIVRVKSSR